MLTHRSQREGRPNMVRRQLGEVSDDLIGGHSRRQVLQHVVDRDARPDEARLAAANIRSHIDQRDQVHATTLVLFRGRRLGLVGPCATAWTRSIAELSVTEAQAVESLNVMDATHVIKIQRTFGAGVDGMQRFTLTASGLETYLRIRPHVSDNRSDGACAARRMAAGPRNRARARRSSRRASPHRSAFARSLRIEETPHTLAISRRTFRQALLFNFHRWFPSHGSALCGSGTSHRTIRVTATVWAT